MANLGFVGLGVMGSRMVKRLLDAGHTVSGYNRTKSKAEWLLDAGMRWADSPAAAARAAEITLSMVTNTAALRAITDGPDGVIAGLSAGKVYVDMSTVSPAADVWVHVRRFCFILHDDHRSFVSIRAPSWTGKRPP